MTRWIDWGDADSLARDAAEARFWAAVERMDLTELCDLLPVSDDGDATALAAALPVLSTWRRDVSRSALRSWGHREVVRPVAGEGGELSGRWLVVVPQRCPREIVAACVAGLAARGADVAPIELADGCSRADVSGQLPHDAAGLVSLLGLDERPEPGCPSLTAGCAATLTLVQALADKESRVPLWCVSCNQPALRGLLRVAAQEHSDFWGGLVDIDEHADWDLVAVAVANSGGEDQLVVRPGTVMARRLVPVGRSGPSQPPWNADGSVLITGGTGRLGACLARWFAGLGMRHLVLVNRTGGQAPGADELMRELTELGAQATVVACDVTNRTELAALVAALPAEHPLTAVVHAASVRQQARIEGLTTAELEAVLAARATAASHLHEITRDLDLRGFVLLCSLAGVCGTRQQAGHAAADESLRALAEHRRDLGLPAIAVASGPWALPGADSRGALLRALRRTGARAMPPARATNALGEILGQHDGAVVLADVDWSRLPVATADGSLFRDIPQLAPARTGDTARPGLPVGMSRVQRRRMLLDLVRGHVAAVAGYHDVRTIDVRKSFRELGFDSVGALDFRNRMASSTGLELPASVVFDHPSPAALVEHLLERFGPPGTALAVGGSAAALLASATDAELFAFVRDELGIV